MSLQRLSQPPAIECVSGWAGTSSSPLGAQPLLNVSYLSALVYTMVAEVQRLVSPVHAAVGRSIILRTPFERLTCGVFLATLARVSGDK